MSVTNNNLGNVILCGAIFRDELLTFTAANTVLHGTIMARDSTSGKLVPYVKGGTNNENGIPKAVMTYDVTSTVAGDVAVRSMISGSVRAPRLIIDADGDASNIDNVVLDELRVYSIVAEDVQELRTFDNQ